MTKDAPKKSELSSIANCPSRNRGYGRLAKQEEEDRTTRRSQVRLAVEDRLQDSDQGRGDSCPLDLRHEEDMQKIVDGR